MHWGRCRLRVRDVEHAATAMRRFWVDVRAIPKRKANRAQGERNHEKAAGQGVFTFGRGGKITREMQAIMRLRR
jgi:hypothetical protein